jgi:hypothetical protein
MSILDTLNKYAGEPQAQPDTADHFDEVASAANLDALGGGIASMFRSFGSALGASAMGYALERGGLTGALGLSVGALGLTAFLTVPFLKRRALRCTFA